MSRSLVEAWPYVIGALALWALNIGWNVKPTRRALEAWAAANGTRLLLAERRCFRRGWRWFRQGAECFRIKVEHASGRTRSGYVRVGGWFTGLISRGDVAWED